MLDLWPTKIMTQSRELNVTIIISLTPQNYGDDSLDRRKKKKK